MEPGLSSSKTGIGKPGGSSYIWSGLILVLLVLFLVSIGAGGVFADSASQTNESRGNGSYGWQQVYEVFDAATGQATRITGTADRREYDFGFKNPQISGRNENYWARDCGWWYVSGTPTLNIAITDGAGDTVYTGSSLSATRGRVTATYNWNISDDDPGRWQAIVDDGTNVAALYFYVRGQLDVVSISASGTLETGNTVTISAGVEDNAGNTIANNEVDNEGNSVGPTVTAFISGAGENFEVTLVDDGTGADSGGGNDGTYRGTFTPTTTGDRKIKVKASDDHTFWVDGSGSTVVSIGGAFPYASPILHFIERIVGSLGGFSLTNFIASVFAALGGVVVLKKRWWVHG